MEKLDIIIREIDSKEVPREAKRGKNGNIVGHYIKKEKEEIPENNSPIILFNKDERFVALARSRRNKELEKEGKIEYLIDMNYNQSPINPRLSQKDYFISFLEDIKGYYLQE